MLSVIASYDKNISTFLTLIRAGLWETAHIPHSWLSDLNTELVGWGKIFMLADEQTVSGILLSGIEKLPQCYRPSQDFLLNLIGNIQVLEYHNKAMNHFISVLLQKMKFDRINVLLVKGQGIAQCYEKPLWRVNGDIDLFLDSNNYKKAINLLSPLASKIDKENPVKRHLSMTIDGWTVELHGTLKTGLWKRLDNGINILQKETFENQEFRIWKHEDTEILLPSPNNDVVFVFCHILQHFFKEGIGLRQICDWCRLLWTYRLEIDHKLLESRLKAMGLITEWKVFAAFSVEYLGMPVDAMPLFSTNRSLNKKAEKVLSFVMETGNFGHKRDYSYYNKYSFGMYKAISFFRHTKDCMKYMEIFPMDSIKVWWSMIKLGVKMAIKK